MAQRMSTDSLLSALRGIATGLHDLSLFQNTLLDECADEYSVLEMCSNEDIRRDLCSRLYHFDMTTQP